MVQSSRAWAPWPGGCARALRYGLGRERSRWQGSRNGGAGIRTYVLHFPALLPHARSLTAYVLARDASWVVKR